MRSGETRRSEAGGADEATGATPRAIGQAILLALPGGEGLVKRGVVSAGQLENDVREAGARRGGKLDGVRGAAMEAGAGE